MYVRAATSSRDKTRKSGSGTYHGVGDRGSEFKCLPSTPKLACLVGKQNPELQDRLLYVNAVSHFHEPDSMGGLGYFAVLSFSRHLHFIVRGITEVMRELAQNGEIINLLYLK